MRTLVLAALALVAVALVVVVRPPERRTGYYAVSGPRLMRLPKHAVRRLAVGWDGRGFDAVRGPDGWRVDGAAAPAGVATALDDLLDALVGLRGLDAFRGEQAIFGFAAPRGAIELVTPHRRRRLVLGALNAAGTAIYARRDGDHRTFLLGTYLLSQLDRVFLQQQAAAAPPAP